jgi:hypothetical protein
MPGKQAAGSLRLAEENISERQAFIDMASVLIDAAEAIACKVRVWESKCNMPTRSILDKTICTCTRTRKRVLHASTLYLHILPGKGFGILRIQAASGEHTRPSSQVHVFNPMHLPLNKGTERTTQIGRKGQTEMARGAVCSRALTLRHMKFMLINPENLRVQQHVFTSINPENRRGNPNPRFIPRADLRKVEPCHHPLVCVVGDRFGKWSHKVVWLHRFINIESFARRP